MICPQEITQGMMGDFPVCALQLHNYIRTLFLPYFPYIKLLYFYIPSDNSKPLLMKQNEGKRRQAVRFKYQHIQTYIESELS